MADASSEAGTPGRPVTVRVDRSVRGVWEVAVPGPETPIACETLDDAKRVAYLCAARWRPCELIVRDAYHRVFRREHIDGRDDPPPKRRSKRSHARPKRRR